MTATGGGTAVVIDLRSRRVPNVVTLGVAAAGLTLATMQGTGLSVGEALAGGVLALAVAIARQRTRTTIARAMAVVHSSDAVAAIERPTENNRFAYAPAIAIGALAAALGL